MVTQRMSTEDVEAFVHEHLKEDLRMYETQLKLINAEIMEYVQLKNMIETILGQERREEFKTQVNIGGNMFMKARADSVEHILVDVGLKVYVEFTIEEASRYVDVKIKVLTKQADTIRDKSIETRANIKLALLVIGDSQRLHTMHDNR
ncbi:protein UXT homolog [Anopheles gambiae]|uniref:protein UXT homolog n=1 Tax=Anopheles gambiae TaxID=7165 RepID=UPI002AC8BB73|nr:protein UXT homolog [Anopheles gambiae]XP_061496730.1 protein UXT homolog [Anopheles gambiae]XP_061496731.1 protein UXT homolog [Anopheles gambiae]